MFPEEYPPPASRLLHGPAVAEVTFPVLHLFVCPAKAKNYLLRSLGAGKMLE